MAATESANRLPTKTLTRPNEQNPDTKVTNYVSTKPKRQLKVWDDSPLTIDERKHPLAKCEECPLGRVGKYVPTSFPEGNGGLAFVGEAPAKNEIRHGEPFVGASGQLLNAVLGNYRTKREDVLLTNACSCNYPQDQFDKLPEQAIEACRPRLLAELDTAGVDTLVLMGNSSVKAVLPPSEARKGITKLRAGPPKLLNIDGHDEPFTVVPTFHPAACMRNQTQFPLMVSDLGKAIAKKKPDLWYEPEIHVVDETWEALAVLKELSHESFYTDFAPVVDTESGRDKDISYGRDDGAYGRILCVGLGLSGGQYEDNVWVFSDRSLQPHPIFGNRVRDEMRDWFHSSGVIMQNGKYDIGVLMSFLDSAKPFRLRFDTMLASYCLNENGGVHGLKYMGQELLGCPDWDSVIKPFITKDQGFGSIPRKLLYRYNAFDVHVTRLLKNYFEPFLKQQNLMPLFEFLLQISEMLTEVEGRGLGFDMKVSKEIEKDYNQQIAAIDGTLPLNPRSVNQLQAFFADNNIDTPSTDEDHLKLLLTRPERRVSADVKSVIERVLASRKVSKLRGTYVTGLQKKYTIRGTIHPSFLIHGTNTGRLSSRGPNSQNIPRSGDIKKQFIPANRHLGWKMVQADYAQAELRVLTWLAKEEKFRDLFNDPERDIFIELCRSMFPDFDTLGKDAAKELRTLIKTFAYGISYGRTAAGIAADPAFNMSVHEAEKHMKAFQAQIPNIMRYQQEEVIERIHRGEDLINAFGRHKRFWLITDMNKTAVHNEAMSFQPQSTASDMCLTAAIRANKEGIYIVNLIHDAILFEAPESEVDDQAALVDKLMVDAAAEITGGYVDFATDYSVGDSWYDVR